MIKGHVGWYSHIYRTWGAVSNYLFYYLNRGPLSKVSEKMDRANYHFLPSRKPQVWYRHPLITLHSFRSQERYIWLQISLVVFHRALIRDLPKESRLLAPYYPFPCVGFSTDDLVIMFCDRLSNQNHERFQEQLKEATRELGTDGKVVRWIHPLGNNFHTKAFSKSNDAVWHNLDLDDLAVLLRPDLEDAHFQVNITNLYRHLNRS